jgi:hypothetical protein
MYELAKSARSKMKAKAERLAGTSNSQTPFYSSGENAGDKTGMRPISERTYKKGGKVSKAGGTASAARADRVKRKSGGRIADAFANKDMKAANKERDGGKDHVGGLKRGGKPTIKKPLSKAAKAATSKAAPAREPAKAVAKAVAPKAPKISEASISPKAAALADAMKPKASAKPLDESTEVTPMGGEETPEEEEAEATTAMKKGGRVKRKAGGRTKGKTNINIVIASPQSGAEQGAMPPTAAPPRMAPAPAPGAAPPPMLAGQSMGGPMAPPPGAGVSLPPSMAGGPPARKSGGRVESYKSLKGGAGSGLGRLKKNGIGSISR